MKLSIIPFIFLLVAMPATLLAGEIKASGEVADEVIIEKAIPAKKAPQKAEEIKGEEAKAATQVPPSESAYQTGRKGTIRAGLIAPGIYAGNKSIDAMMSFGAEGEYFLFEKLSAGLRIEVATDFQSNSDYNSILSFVPRARYVFDFDNHPRWSIYAQAGAGVALGDGETVAADIAIPGGGFWWQWTEKWSVGADASMHILARSDVAVAFCFSPAIRYEF